MSRWSLAALALSIAGSASALPLARGATSCPEPKGDERRVCMDAFYEVLEEYGTWISTDRYGMLFCPHPDRFDPDFRPFAKGHWVMSEAGWTFVGDHPVSWVTDHYGRWVEAGLHGCRWGWIPGDLWSPAWVEFHVSERVVAWRPAPFDGVPVSLRVPPGTRLQQVVLGPDPSPRSTSGLIAVLDSDFASPRIEDVLLSGPRLHSALREVTPLADIQAGLHSRHRYDVVAQAQAARGVPIERGVPPEPATRLIKPGGARSIAGAVNKGGGKGREAHAAGPRPGETPPGSGKVYQGGDQHQGGFTREGPQGGIKVLEWGKPRQKQHGSGGPSPPPLDGQSPSSLPPRIDRAR